MIWSGHILICGFETVGLSAVRALRHARIHAADLWVIDAANDRCEAARKLAHRTVVGNASDLSRMCVAHVGTALEVIVCEGDASTSAVVRSVRQVGDASTSAVVRSVRQVASSARVKVALQTDAQRAAVLSAGASEVVVLAQVAGALLALSVAG